MPVPIVLFQLQKSVNCNKSLTFTLSTSVQQHQAIIRAY